MNVLRMVILMDFGNVIILDTHRLFQFFIISLDFCLGLFASSFVCFLILACPGGELA